MEVRGWDPIRIHNSGRTLRHFWRSAAHFLQQWCSRNLSWSLLKHQQSKGSTALWRQPCLNLQNGLTHVSARATVQSSMTDNGADRAPSPDGRAPTFREVAPGSLCPPAAPRFLGHQARRVNARTFCQPYFIPHQNRAAEPKTSDRACKLANVLAEWDKSRLSDSLPGTPCRVCEGPSWYWSSALWVRSNRSNRSCFGTARLPRSAATTRATCKPWCPDVTRRHHRAGTSRHAPSSLPLNSGFYVHALCLCVSLNEWPKTRFLVFFFF